MTFFLITTVLQKYSISSIKSKAKLGLSCPKVFFTYMIQNVSGGIFFFSYTCSKTNAVFGIALEQICVILSVIGSLGIGPSAS